MIIKGRPVVRVQLGVEKNGAAILENRALQPGESGEDATSSEGCPHCWANPGDWGVSCRYTWDETRHGWAWESGCSSCSFTEAGFLPASS